MSEAAKHYYLAQASEIGATDMPPILSGEPKQLYTYGDMTGLGAAQREFNTTLQSVAPFVRSGVPAAYAHLGEPLPPEQWQRIQTLGQSPYIKTEALLFRNYIIPLMVRAQYEGANYLAIEAAARHEIPAKAIRRALSSRPEYAEEPYAATQAYLLVRAVGQRGLAAAQMFIAQGVHTSGYPRAPGEFLSTSYWRTRLLSKELEQLPVT